MDRRVFLLGSLALAGCGPLGGTPPEILCDPDLVPALKRAAAAYPGGGGGFRITAMPPRALLERADGPVAVIVVTREPKIADHIQRNSLARLQNRWKPYLGEERIQVVVTRGSGERAGARFGKWLASDAAAPYLAAPTPVLLTVP